MGNFLITGNWPGKICRGEFTRGNSPDTFTT